jgi:hypothetical protein
MKIHEYKFCKKTNVKVLNNFFNEKIKSCRKNHPSRIKRLNNCKDLLNKSLIENYNKPIFINSQFRSYLFYFYDWFPHARIIGFSNSSSRSILTLKFIHDNIGDESIFWINKNINLKLIDIQNYFEKIGV